MNRILIVDDDAEHAESLASLLKPRYEVETASNGFSALDLLRKSRFDLILLDVVMPGLDGPGFLQEAKVEIEFRPIILVSAVPETDRIAERLGVAGYLNKPVRIRALESLIERVVGRTPQGG